MKISAIKRQIKRADRYSIFVDGKYAFSLSDSALLESKLVAGQELSDKEVKQFKRLSDDDKIYGLALRYLALRPRSKWEIETYLDRKKSPPDLKDKILNKLSDNGLIDDVKFAEAFVNDARLLKQTARRKLIQQLRQKRVSEDVILSAVGDDPQTENEALAAIIARKRRQSKYHDDLKLMQYLTRQGFNYGDIKAALQADADG